MPVSYQWQQRFDRWRNATRGFFGGGGGDNQPRPKLCPACNSLVGINATRCHECGANLRFSLAALSKGLTGFFGGQAPATTAILIANVIMFAATLLIGFAKGQGQGFGILFSVNGEALYRLGMAIPFRYDDFNWYRLLTATYLHGGLIHIGFNMMVLLGHWPGSRGSLRQRTILFFLHGLRNFWLSAQREIWLRSRGRRQWCHFRTHWRLDRHHLSGAAAHKYNSCAAASFPGSLRFSPSDYFSAVCVPTTGATLAASPLVFCLAATSPTANR